MNQGRLPFHRIWKLRDETQGETERFLYRLEKARLAHNNWKLSESGKFPSSPVSQDSNRIEGRHPPSVPFSSFVIPRESHIYSQIAQGRFPPGDRLDAPQGGWPRLNSEKALVFPSLVSSRRECNSSKRERPAADFLRSLYREGRITGAELIRGLQSLDDLAAGNLRPVLPAPALRSAAVPRSALAARTGLASTRAPGSRPQ